jgi:tetrapyrrole methylase family protein / MazG family protein
MGAEIVVVGLGPGPVKYLTGEARETLLAERELYFRVVDHPVALWLREEGRDIVSFDPLYAAPGMSYEKVYRTIVATLIKTAQRSGRAVYGVPGHPFVFEKTPRWLRARGAEAGVAVRTVAGLSFLEQAYGELGIDPEEGLQVLNGFNFGSYGDYPFTEKLGLLIGQVGFPTASDPTRGDNNVGALMAALRRKFPADHPVTLLWSSGMPDYINHTRTFPLGELQDQSGFVRHLASLYVPPIKPPWEWVSNSKGVV